MTNEPQQKQGNYTYLLLGLLLLLFVAPFVSEHQQEYARILFHVVLAATLLIGVWSLVRERKWFLLGLSLAALSVLLNSTALFLDQLTLIYLIIIVQLLFLFLTLVIAFYDVVLVGQPDLNKIMGAVCIYLLLGIIWAFVYLAINLALPGSFSGVKSASPDRQMSELLYYSFITLTTLGYGDISPATHLARVFAYFEAILGQFFLAILVAGLVGAHIATRFSQR
jgi:voltage-gated potassium channel